MEFAIIDVVFFAIMLVIVVNAAVKGFLAEFFSKAAFVLGILGGALFYKKLMPYILPDTPVASAVLSFVALFIVCYLLIQLIQLIVKRVFVSGQIMKGLDHSLGFFFGIVEALAVISVILLILYLQKWIDVTSWLENSFFHKILRGMLASPESYFNALTSHV